MDELQDILHSNPLITLTPSMAEHIAESSSKFPYLRLFLSITKLEAETQRYTVEKVGNIIMSLKIIHAY